MPKRRIRAGLWTIAAGLIVGGALSIAATLRLPLATPTDQLKPAVPSTASSPSHTVAEHPTADIDGLREINLRRPLHDAPLPPPQPAKAPPPPPALKIRLTGTIIEPDRKRAVIATSDGQIAIKSIGDEADGARIMSIDDRSITVSYFGQSLVLALAKGDGT